MQKILGFSIISKCFKFLTSSSDTLYLMSFFLEKLWLAVKQEYVMQNILQFRLSLIWMNVFSYVINQTFVNGVRIIQLITIACFFKIVLKLTPVFVKIVWQIKKNVIFFVSILCLSFCLIYFYCNTVIVKINLFLDFGEKSSFSD